MRSLSNDLRKRVINAVEDGMSRHTAAERFCVAVSTAIRWVERWRASGNYQPRPQGGDHRSHHIEAHASEILALVEDDKDITLVEIDAHLEDRHGRRFASSTIWRLLDRHDMTFKKTAHAAEQQRADVLARRRAWFAGQLDLDPDRLVIIDETGLPTKACARA